MTDIYDRQVRLWGDTAQRELTNAHVVALGMSLSVVSALKSLLLCGIGRLTLVASTRNQRVTAKQLGEHFFLPISRLGEGLADALKEELQTLNLSCTVESEGRTVDEWVIDWRESMEYEKDGRQPAPTLPSLIMVSHEYTDWSPFSDLSFTASWLQVPLVFVEAACGLFGGSISSHYQPDMFIPLRIATSVDHTVMDLRPFTPFPVLRKWLEEHRPAAHAQHPHLSTSHSGIVPHPPYLLLLYHAYQQWQHETGHVGGASTPHLLPSDYDQLRGIIRGMYNDQEEGKTVRWLTADSVMDAIQRCTPQLNRASSDINRLPAQLRELLGHPWAEEPINALTGGASGAFIAPSHPHSSLGHYHWLEGYQMRAKQHCSGEAIEGGANDASSALSLRLKAYQRDILLWYVISGVRRFYDEMEQQLPFNGFVPDFPCCATQYRALKDLYQQKHREDVQWVANVAIETFLSDRASLYRSAASSKASSIKGSMCNCDDFLLLSSTSDARYLPSLQTLFHQLAQSVVSSVWSGTLVSFRSSHFAVARLSHHATQHEGSCVIRDSVRPGLSRRIQRLLQYAVQGDGGNNDDGEVRGYRSRGIEAIAAAVMIVVQETRHTQASHACRGWGDCPEWLFSVVASVARESLDSFPTLREEIQRTVMELWRQREVEVPCVSACVGSLAAQEAVKLIQHQRIPHSYPFYFFAYSNTVWVEPH